MTTKIFFNFSIFIIEISNKKAQIPKIKNTELLKK